MIFFSTFIGLVSRRGLISPGEHRRKKQRYNGIRILLFFAGDIKYSFSLVGSRAVRRFVVLKTTLVR